MVKHFDIKYPAPKKNSHSTVQTRNSITVPVTLGFDWNVPPLGWLEIKEEYVGLLEAGMVLSAAYMTEPEHKLIGMGIIPISTPEPTTPVQVAAAAPPARYQGFMWHLFLMALAAWLLAVMTIIIRLNYVKP